MQIRKLYEDDNFVIIDKPVNIMVHPDGRSQEYTLVDWFIENYPDSKNVGDEGRPGIVHRLDKDTTGALILAKTDSAFKYFKRSFKDHTIKKTYRAIVLGHMKSDTGIIDAPISRSKSDFRKRAILNQFSPDTRGTERDAITRYKVIGRYKWADGTPYTYVEVYPETGRTHQIRVHFRGIRHPIIGDDLYGPKSDNVANRQMLHAYKLSFRPPMGEKDMEIICDLPEDFKNILNAFVK